MADSRYIVELQETIEKMNAELSQSNTKISELCVKVREQEEAAQKEMAKLREENARLARDLKEVQDCQGSVEGRIQKLEELLREKEKKLIWSEEKCNAVQERLEFFEQKLAEFSQKAEVTAEKSLAQVDESNDGINSLPEEIILKIFGYIRQNHLCQIARVCRRWSVLSKSPVLWKKVNVDFSSIPRCQTTVAKSFINTLPSCVTSIRLDFEEHDDWIEPFDFAELCVKLQEKCPHLKEFILTVVELSHSLSSVLNLCMQFLQDVKNLEFHNCKFLGYSPKVEFSGTSKIEVLDLFFCEFSHFDEQQFSKMPFLKVLHLFHTIVSDFCFHGNTSFFNQLHLLDLGGTDITASTLTAIQNHGFNLKELYICGISVQNHNLNFNNSVFPHLKTICLSRTFVTCRGVVFLIQSCPSLENVYVDEDVAESFAAHPFVVANRCKSGIVKVIVWCHNHYVST